MQSCPLCHSSSVVALATPHCFSCGVCRLIFKETSVHLNAAHEKARYQLHENDPDNQDYRSFLNRLLDPLVSRLDHGMTGLDFGCGPTTAASIILAEKKITCASFDPYFFNDTHLLSAQYDFVVCSEVVEHFNKPRDSFDMLFKLLKPNSWLAIMTQSPPSDFVNWNYQRDPTHVAFYSDETFSWLANQYAFELIKISNSIRLLKRIGP